jgi:hypothetical protein
MIVVEREDVRGEGGAGRGGRGQACVWSALNLCDFKMRDVGGDCASRVTVWCAGCGIGDAGCKALASALAKLSGLRVIVLTGTLVLFDDCGWERGCVGVGGDGKGGKVECCLFGRLFCF